MCSIAGIISPDPGRVSPAILERMNNALAHRGPDGRGYYQDHRENIHAGFAHNRLSIVDLSDLASQPLRYKDRYQIIFNGEIYNHPEIRNELKRKGYPFRSQSDTEVIAAAYAEFGQECLQMFDGMFAFAIWDEADACLFCARDRFGEKPFYWHYNDEINTIYFASEIKALFKAGIEKTADPVMLYNYLTLGFTKRPDQPEKTFYKNILQLPPSHYLVFKPSQELVEISRYWDLDKESTSELNEADAIEQFSNHLTTSISRRLRSDVAVGTSLSGGLDSSSIAAIIAGQPAGAFSYQTFSAVFPGFEKDESARILALSDQFHLTLHTVSPDQQDLADHLYELVHTQDEPFGSASVFAQSMVYAEASKHGIKVLLDGQGADEVLAGYKKYTHWYLQYLVNTKGWAQATKEAEKFKQNEFLDQWSWKNWIASKLPALTATQLEKKARRQQTCNPHIHPEFAEQAKDRRSIYKPLVEKLNDIQYHDLMLMGLEELLRYADRNSMASGVEIRLPFLSHQLVQFIFSLPSAYRMREGYTKWILRKAMDNKLPKEICWQKGKIGFEPPQKTWMQQEVAKNMIHQSRQKLVDHKICDRSVLTKPIVPSDTHGADNFDFRSMIAGVWIGLID